MPANYIKDLESTFPRVAPAVLKVLQAYKLPDGRRIFGTAPNMCSKLKDIPIEVIDEALSIYMKKAEEDHKAPHPNYFLTICFTLSKKQRPAKGNEDDEPPLMMGRII